MARKSKAPADFDLSAVAVEQVDADEFQRPSKYESSPLAEPLLETYNSNRDENGEVIEGQAPAPAGVTVPDAAVQRVRGELNGAAKAHGIGVKVIIRPAYDEEGEPIEGQTLVMFCGKDRTERKRKAKENGKTDA